MGAQAWEPLGCLKGRPCLQGLSKEAIMAVSPGGDCLPPGSLSQINTPLILPSHSPAMTIAGRKGFIPHKKKNIL